MTVIFFVTHFKRGEYVRHAFVAASLIDGIPRTSFNSAPATQYNYLVVTGMQKYAMKMRADALTLAIYS